MSLGPLHTARVTPAALLSESASELESRPPSPLAPDQRIYKPLPKRCRLHEHRDDGEEEPLWHHGAALSSQSTTDDDVHPSLDTATSSTENDQDGPPTPPPSSVDPLAYASIFSSVHALVKDAAAATTLFGGAADQIQGPPIDPPPVHAVRDRPGRVDGDGSDYPAAAYSHYAAQSDTEPTAGQFARLAAAASLIGPGDGRADEDDDPRVDERERDDDYVRRGGANKKKRKVPSAANGHAFSSPPISPTSLPAPSSMNGVGGLFREKDASTGMRANFASAMVGVVKAMNSAGARTGASPARIPSISSKRYRERPELYHTQKPEPVVTAPAPTPFVPAKLTKKAARAAAVAIRESQVTLHHLYDPSLGPALSRSPRLSPPPPAAPYHFDVPDGDFVYECAPSRAISSRMIELERERIKLKRARDLILERARDLESARQSAREAGSAKPKRPPASKNAASGKSYVSVAVQTDGPQGGHDVWVTPRSTPAPSNAPKKAPLRKGKKKRSAHANANNVHHRDNYIPSRPARTTAGPGQSAHLAASPPSAVPLLRPGASLDLVDPNSPFYVPGPDAHPQLGISLLAPFFASIDEWLCSFCESRILYGSQSSVNEAIRKRKGVLKVRRRAQERAAKAASGQPTSKPKPKGKVGRAIPTRDVACGPGDDLDPSLV